MLKIYKNKKVFITGHTGFKGSWLSLWLKKLGASVCGYSLEPDTKPSMFAALDIKNRLDKSITGNILDKDLLEKTINEFKPDIVFHLAAQPLVRRSYKEPFLTYNTNVIGTLNVLEAAKKCESVTAFVNITTDKCYENKNQNEGYKETDALGGYDMYSSSKACAEILSSSFRRSFLNENGYLLATARAGNVIGGGDWAEDRLIPDCIRSIKNGKKIEIRNPYATRPWQHVLEPLSGYLLLGSKLLENKQEYASSFNFGPEEESVHSVYDVVNKVIQSYKKGEVVVNRKDNLHEANLLSLNIDKAKEVLGWYPAYNYKKAIEETVNWYKKFYENNQDMYKYSISQIEEYEANIKWNKN